jgi:hypothetical protein
MSREKLAGMVTAFASDPTYKSFPSLRAMIAIQVKNKMGKIEEAERIEIYKLIPLEHQTIFKASLDLADKIHSQTYPKGGGEEDIFKKMKERRAKLEAEKNEREQVCGGRE